jgi:hypothetical protein
MKWLERRLFPQSRLLNFFTIAGLSIALSFLLIGRQIWQTNWGIIDDFQIFDFLGSDLRLPVSEIWDTLLTKTEVGTLQGRFRPSYYSFILLETSLWGDNVHLWYLARTAGFALFLASIWWFMERFIGVWLSGVLTAYISLLPMWAGVWSRLGPSEIYGSAFIGVMIFASYFVLFTDSPRIRGLSAIVLTLATFALVGAKETFVPLAGGSIAVLILAWAKSRLSLPVTAVLVLAILCAAGGILVVVRQQLNASGGEDFYAKATGVIPTLSFAAKGLLSAIAQTLWIVVIPVWLLSLLNVIPRKPLKDWIAGSWVAVGAYCFLLVTYALQCALYRSGFPLNSRYDFPAMLLVPLTCCILACEFSSKIRPFYSERTINYAQFAAAAFVLFYCATGTFYFDKGRATTIAVRNNIESTNSFFNELQRAIQAARVAPDNPVILEAYGPGAYEAVFSLATYLSSHGARNPISVRLHADEKSTGNLYDGLQRQLLDMQQSGRRGLTPLRDSLASSAAGCISIGINGLPDAACKAFQVRAP